MTTSYFPQDDDWYDGGFATEFEPYDDGQTVNGVPFDIVTLAAVFLIVIALVSGLSKVTVDKDLALVKRVEQQNQAVEEAPAVPAAPLAPIPGADTFIMPYNEYILTQGPHGMSYGHHAIDIAAGKGEPVLSPINGRVSQLYVDAIGNPTLVIENEVYEVTMMHGSYNVAVGQEVQVGQQVGLESNQGNTRDMSGRSCRNRDCGYHTHLNVFSKTVGRNVNPLDLLPKPYAN